MIKQFVTNTNSDVFALKGLPSEICSYLFARYSRSREGLRESLGSILSELGIRGREEVLREILSEAIYEEQCEGVHLEAKKTKVSDWVDKFNKETSLDDLSKRASKFTEKFVIGYGHLSVAELSNIYLALEGIPDYLHVWLCRFRLTSPQVKSSRFVDFNYKDIPHIYLDDPSLQSECDVQLRTMMEFYLNSLQKVKNKLIKKTPIREGQTQKGYETLINTGACDIVRGLLPMGIKTNMGLMVNARELAYILNRMMSEDSDYFQEYARKIQTEAEVISPTLLKYISKNHYYEDKYKKLDFEFTPIFPDERSKRVRIPWYPREEDVLLEIAVARILMNETYSYEEIKTHLINRPEKVKEIVLDLFEGCERFDTIHRALEAVHLPIQFMGDWGSYRDLNRHRIGSAFDAPPNPDHGICISDEMKEHGLEEKALLVFEDSKHLYYKIMGRCGDVHKASLLIPMATNYSYFRTWNFRQIYNVIRLRSGKEGHIQYRRIAWDLHDEVCRVAPSLLGLMAVDREESQLARQGAKVTQ